MESTCINYKILKKYLPLCTPESGSAQTWRTRWRNPLLLLPSSWPSWVTRKKKYVLTVSTAE